MTNVEAVGTRIMLLRPESQLTVDSLKHAESSLRRVLAGRADRSVLIVDLRQTPVLDARAAGALVEVMGRVSSITARVALLLNASSPTQAMQFERLVREAGSPMRQCFRDISALEHWLEETVSAVDRGALRVHLAPSIAEQRKTD